MNDIKKYNNYRYLSIIISFFISVGLYALSLKLSWYGTVLSGLILFIPVILVAFICFIGLYTEKKFPRATKYTTIILNMIIIGFIQIFMCGLFTLFFADLNEPDVTDIRDYKHALKSIGWHERIKHFPKKLPDNVSNKRVYKYANHWFGSEGIYLTFVADNDYIKNELTKYNYKKIEGPFDNASDYEYTFQALDPNNLRIEGYKLYIIEKGTEAHNNYSFGFATKDNKFMYYYSFPD